MSVQSDPYCYCVFIGGHPEIKSTSSLLPTVVIFRDQISNYTRRWAFYETICLKFHKVIQPVERGTISGNPHSDDVTIITGTKDHLIETYKEIEKNGNEMR